MRTNAFFFFFYFPKVSGLEILPTAKGVVMLESKMENSIMKWTFLEESKFEQASSSCFGCSQSRDAVRPHHLGDYLCYYLCTSWQEPPWVSEAHALAHTDSTGHSGERASVFGFKIEWRVCDDSSQTSSVASFCQKACLSEGEGPAKGSTNDVQQVLKCARKAPK